MKSNSQLSMTLHLLLHMADMEGPVTSETLAAAMNTNAVVIRRMMAGLRAHKLVASKKGHHGGWTLTRALADMTLRDVYEALGSPQMLALNHRTENPHCLVEQAVNATLEKAFEDAEALLLARFGEVPLVTLQSTIRAARDNHASHCLKVKSAS